MLYMDISMLYTIKPRTRWDRTGRQTCILLRGQDLLASSPRPFRWVAKKHASSYHQKRLARLWLACVCMYVCMYRSEETALNMVATPCGQVMVSDGQLYKSLLVSLPIWTGQEPYNAVTEHYHTAPRLSDIWWSVCGVLLWEIVSLRTHLPVCECLEFPPVSRQA